MSLTPEELRQKIRDAQAKETPAAAGPRKPASSESSKALRMGTDFVAAIIVGIVLGYWLDRWLHSEPFCMIIFMFVGFAAGFMNIYRSQTRPGNKTDDKKTD